LNASNLASGTVPQARKWSATTVTTTGTINNLNFSNADQVLMANASAATITGLAAGVAGQRVTLISVGAGHVDLAHQNGNSTFANRLTNFARSGNTSLAAGFGAATYEYDATVAAPGWRLVSHEQGAFISHPYSAGDYTGNGSMTWTVGSDDVVTFDYFLSGRQITVLLVLANTTVGGTASTQLSVVLPGGFNGGSTFRGPFVAFIPAGMTLGRFLLSGGSASIVLTLGGTNWTLGTNNTTIEAVIVGQVS
jgi:hypothetical protein